MSFLAFLGLSTISEGLAWVPVFTAVQTSPFSALGEQSNAWGSFDDDGDLDLIITFRDAPIRLYLNRPDGF